MKNRIVYGRISDAEEEPVPAQALKMVSQATEAKGEFTESAFGGTWTPEKSGSVFIWPPLARSRWIYGKTWCRCIPLWLLLWGGPCVLGGLGFLLQNFQLRIGTYYYVHTMTQYKLNTHFQPTNTTGANDIALTIGRYPEDVSFGSLNDPVVEALGPYMASSTSFLDGLAIVFPLGFVALVVATDTPFVWTRVMLCFFVLAFGKGLFGWITVEPASDGWRACSERLRSHYSVAWYAEVRSTWELFWMNPGSRVCGDMMWSGHTYFVTLFAFGFLECTHLALRGSARRLRRSAQVVVFLLFLLQQSVEIYFVLRSRFHYTADVAMAVFVTYLLYTNGAIAITAQWWLYPGDEAVEKLVKELTHSKSISLKWVFALRSGGSINVCCDTCDGCTSQLYSSRQLNKIMDMIEEAQEGRSEGSLGPLQRRLIEFENGMVSKHIVGTAVCTV